MNNSDVTGNQESGEEWKDPNKEEGVKEERAEGSGWEREMERHHRQGRIWTGLFILLIGAVALLKSFNVPLPEWLFTWQMLLIALGLFIGLRHGFRRGGWFVPVLIGLAFMANDYFLAWDMRKHIWPVLLILVGIILIIRPRNKRCRRHNEWHERRRAHFRSYMTESTEKYSQEDYVDSTSIFGGSKKKIITKDFKGGDIVNVFGGTELDLSQADIQKKAELEIAAVFGGASIIIPSNWIVKSEAVTIFGGIQDKRSLPTVQEPSDKVLILKGTVIFGGIEIKSF